MSEKKDFVWGVWLLLEKMSYSNLVLLKDYIWYLIEKIDRQMSEDEF